MDKFEKYLKETVESCIEQRCKQWAEYYFEKEFLPSLISEVKERVQVSMVEIANSRKISVEITLDGTPVM